MSTVKGTISSENFEKRVQLLVAAFPYPPTPDLTAAARSGATGVRAWQRKRRSTVMRLALSGLLALAMVSLLVPGVRAAVLEFLQIGSLRINLQTPTPVKATTTPAGAYAPEPSKPPAILTVTPQPSLFMIPHLAGETNLAQAQASWGDPILLPDTSNELGPPDRVYQQRSGAPLLILMWLDQADESRLIASLILARPGAFLTKTPPGAYTQVQVRDQPGLWLQGEHILFLQLSDGSGDAVLLVQGNVLVWEENGITYRLESYYDLQQSQAIAAGMQPYP